MLKPILGFCSLKKSLWNPWVLQLMTNEGREFWVGYIELLRISPRQPSKAVSPGHSCLWIQVEFYTANVTTKLSTVENLNSLSTFMLVGKQCLEPTEWHWVLLHKLLGFPGAGSETTSGLGLGEAVNWITLSCQSLSPLKTSPLAAPFLPQPLCCPEASRASYWKMKLPWTWEV
jgi:hypothetical protein